MTEFLHELIKKQTMNQVISQMVDEFPDPWEYSEPPPPLTLQQDTTWDSGYANAQL